MKVQCKGIAVLKGFCMHHYSRANKLEWFRKRKMVYE